MFRKLVSLLIAVSFLLIGTAAFTIAAEKPPLKTQPPATVTIPPATIKSLPDLVVVSATVSYMSLNMYKFYIDVRNQGGAAARPFEVKVVYEWEKADYSKELVTELFNVNGLGPGSTYKIDRLITSGTMYHPGKPKIKEVIVDFGNKVAESNEGNNEVIY